MPSRRRVLGILGAAATGFATGCVGGGEATTGIVWQKQIIVQAPAADGGTTQTDVLQVSLDADSGHVYGRYDPEFVAGVVGDGGVVVSEEVHRELVDTFPDFRYHVGVNPQTGSPDATNAAAKRGDFNAVSLGARATVSTYRSEEGIGYVRLHDTGRREVEPSWDDVRTADIEGRGSVAERL